jgi:FtsP/CotA-like multicopper oxidase with cupredoxin domain
LRNALFLPPAGAATTTLTAAPATLDIGGGAMAGVLAYNAGMPGPTLVADRGSAVSVAFVNALDVPSTVHWHGLIVPTAVDGQPHEVVAPGGSFAYDFVVNQRAGLSFYHPHPHLDTGRQVNLGLAGAFIVRDPEEAALGLPGDYREVPLVVRDALLDSAGALAYKPKSTGFVGSFGMVNGTRDAALGVENAVYRLRILNGSNARVFRLAFTDATLLVVIGNDGGLLAAPVPLAEVGIAPGERLDVLVDLGGRVLGDRLMLRCLDAGWDLLELEVTRETTIPGAVPTGALSTIEPLGTPVRTRDFSFDGMGKINGQTYVMGRTDFEVPFGETELWRLTTGGNAPHPVHVHGVSFQVVSRTGGRNAVQPWETGWKDTVLLADSETVEVLVRFDGYRGRYLMHCHQLEHEDNGMMTEFQVV